MIIKRVLLASLLIPMIALASKEEKLAALEKMGEGIGLIILSGLGLLVFYLFSKRRK